MTEDNVVATSTETQHSPMSIGKKLLTIAFSVIVVVSFNFGFFFLATYILDNIFDSAGLFFLCSFIVPSVIVYSLLFLFWKSHSFFRKCFLYLNLCSIGLGILLYILLPLPLRGCSKESDYSRVAGIFIYLWDSWDWESSRRVPEAYIWNFRCRPDDDIYDGQTNKYIYYSGAGTSESLIIAGADPATFESFSGTDYAKDKDHVFLGNSIIGGADPTTFTPIVTSPDSMVYAKDKNHVYWGNSIISEADPNTFEYISAGNEFKIYVYFKDKNHVYIANKIIPEADPSTFEILSSTYISRDKNNVYKGVVSIPEADPSTFEILSADIFRDKNRYYEGITPILNIDPVRWTYVGASFFTDRRRVYNSQTKNMIRGIDVEHFSCIKDTKTCRDKNYFYYTLSECSGKDCKYSPQKYKILTLDEVKLHNSPGDCWTVYGTWIHDATQYYTESGYRQMSECDQNLKDWESMDIFNIRKADKYKIGEIASN